MQKEQRVHNSGSKVSQICDRVCLLVCVVYFVVHVSMRANLVRLLSFVFLCIFLLGENGMTNFRGILCKFLTKYQCSRIFLLATVVHDRYDGSCVTCFILDTHITRCEWSCVCMCECVDLCVCVVCVTGCHSDCVYSIENKAISGHQNCKQT